MDKWLRQHASNRQKPKEPQKMEQERKEERDLQLALEESQFASDMEKAIALSLCEVNTHTSTHHSEQQISVPKSTLPDSARRHGSTVSVTTPATIRTSLNDRGKKTKNTISRKPTPSAPPPPDTWAVETFVNNLLNQSAASTTKIDDEADSFHSEDSSSEPNALSFATNTYDEDATTDDDTSQPQKSLNSAIITDIDIDDDATVDEDDEAGTANATTEHDHDSDNNWEIVDDIDDVVPFGTPDHASTPKQAGHDAEAELQFFSQFHRETWDKDELRLSHDAMKRRSMASALKKNKKQRTYLSHGPSTSDGHNYYTTADDVLEDAFDAAGFGDSAAGLSWEGIGQSRYA